MTSIREGAEYITCCTACGCKHIIRDYERGELICEKCGLVLEDNFIDLGDPVRHFEGDTDNSHYGKPKNPRVHDGGLATEMGNSNRDYNGKPLPMRNRAMVYRMRKWQRRVRIANGAERNVAIAMQELDKVSSKLGLKETIRDDAATIYRNAVKKNLIRGRSIHGVVAASLYAACRQDGLPRTLDEIADESPAGRKEIGRTYRFMVRELRMKMKPTRPEDYVARFCSSLDLSVNVQQKTTDILREASEKELISGRGPTGVAAAAIYISAILCNERRTQKEVADVAGVTEVTIRNRYKELSEKLGIDVQI